MATVHWWEYTSDETGACVRALADRVVRHASGSKVRVDVRRGDGRGLVRMLRDGLPRGVEIDDNASASSSSMRAKLDVSVHVASHVLSLCNVAKVAARLPPGPPLAKYAEWVTANLGTIDARVNAILGGGMFLKFERSLQLSAAEAALRTLLGYERDTNWATLDEVEATAIRDAVEPLGKAFEILILNDTCIEVLGLATTQEDRELFQTFQLALAAGQIAPGT
jgi:hypothetical protein